MSAFYFIVQITVGGGYDTHIYRYRFFPPIRVIFRSSSTRSNLTCASRGSSPTSSRNNVPPFARSKVPAFASLASVKAPRSWPNSSLSINVRGMAPQLIATKAPFARRLLWWTARAISSFPVPLSPWIRTVALVSATRRNLCHHLFQSCVLADHVASFFPQCLFFQGGDFTFMRLCSTARLTVSNNLSLSKGFSIKS